MPLTDFQYKLGRLLAGNRSEDSYLAGGAAILMQPNTKRISQDGEATIVTKAVCDKKD